MIQYVNEQHGVDSFGKYPRPSPQCTNLRLVAPDKRISEDLWLKKIVGTTTIIKGDYNMQIHNTWLRAERAGCRVKRRELLSSWHLFCQPYTNPNLPFKRLAFFWSMGTSLRQPVTARLGLQWPPSRTSSVHPMHS